MLKEIGVIKYDQNVHITIYAIMMMLIVDHVMIFIRFDILKMLKIMKKMKYQEENKEKNQPEFKGKNQKQVKGKNL